MYYNNIYEHSMLFMWLSYSVMLVSLRKSHKRHSLDDLAAILDLVAILDYFARVPRIKLLVVSQSIIIPKMVLLSAL